MGQHIKPFSKILIANRGEIACRVIRSAKAKGYATVAIFSDADAGARHVLEADEAFRLGAGPLRESYLSAERVLAAANLHFAASRVSSPALSTSEIL